jgi:hypothetical protein
MDHLQVRGSDVELMFELNPCLTAIFEEIGHCFIRCMFGESSDVHEDCGTRGVVKENTCCKRMQAWKCAKTRAPITSCAESLNGGSCGKN